MTFAEDMQVKICEKADELGLLDTYPHAMVEFIRRELKIKADKFTAVMSVIRNRIGQGPPSKNGVYSVRLPRGYKPPHEILVSYIFVYIIHIEMKNRS